MKHPLFQSFDRIQSLSDGQSAVWFRQMEHYLRQLEKSNIKSDLEAGVVFHGRDFFKRWLPKFAAFAVVFSLVIHAPIAQQTEDISLHNLVNNGGWPVSVGTTIEGRSYAVDPWKHHVGVFGVYIRTRTGWWTKPTFAKPTASINIFGVWKAKIATTYSDENCVEIAVFLTPRSFMPPPCHGASDLPSELDGYASVRVVR